MPTRFLLLGLLTIAALTPAGPINATACDTYYGMRSERAAAVKGYASDELEKLDFLPRVDFPDTPAAGENVLGVNKDSRSSSFTMELAREPGKLVFKLSDEGKNGRIMFIIPGNYVEFATDTREKQDENALMGPPLYVEWRMSGVVQLDGIFAAATRKSHAQLILHGRGNACRSADDFHAWSLIVKGNGADFTLLGRFKQAH